MDSSDIYYSSSNNTEWINNTVLVQNEEISWGDTGPEITVDYSEAATNIEHTLNSTDGYETADPSDNTDTSQYFSILESTITETDNTLEENPKCVLNVEVEKEETIIPDITAAESEIEELNLDDKISENEVILYRPAGSEELYAVQIAEDEHGNLQKYKFKVRQNEDGQFEAIPGTMEVESANDSNDLNTETVNDTNTDFENFVEEKSNAMMMNSTVGNEEPFEFMNENEENSDMEIDYIQNGNLPASEIVNNVYEPDQDEEYQTVEGVHVTGDSDSRNDFEFTVSNINERTEEDSEEEYEVEELEEAFQDDNTNDADEDGITHIFSPEIRETHTTSVLQHKANISNLKIPILETENLKHNVTIYKDDKHLSYLVIRGKEKENVLLDRKTKFNTINMRSILKCNNPSFVAEKCAPSKVEKPQHSVPSIISNKDSNLKHAVKPKEAISPVKSKSARQPRKQSLNPVNRVGSEIIVQPLVYSVDEMGDNKIIPPSKHKRIVSEVLQVSDDSDPEFVLKSMMPKKKRGRPKKRQNSVEITILDSDEEEEKSETNSVIEVPSDQESKEDTDNENDVVVAKEAEEDTKVKKNVKSPSPVKKYKCHLCPKSFPRMLILNRHIDMHKARKFLRSKQNTENKEVNTKPSLNTKISETANKDNPVTYNCKKCKLKFYLERQFKRHQTVHASKKPVDNKINVINKRKTIEKQEFSGSRNLRSNSRITKENSLSEKNLVKATKNHFKCEYCGQTFSTRSFLFSHRNTHKTFPCPNCKTTFTAKILLDDHLRKNCVKSPVKALRQSLRNVTKKPLIKKSSFVKCDTCSRVFPNQKSLQIHNSVSHRKRSYRDRTPGKIPLDISEKEIGLLITNKAPHGGVPMSLKMKQAFFGKMKQIT